MRIENNALNIFIGDRVLVISRHPFGLLSRAAFPALRLRISTFHPFSGVPRATIAR
jgi:hypothetical protein